MSVITVPTTGFDAGPASGGSAVIESVREAANSGMSSLFGREVTKSDRPELTAAKIIEAAARRSCQSG